MTLVYTKHLKTRLKQREIPIKIVREIIKKGKEQYWDTLRNHYIIISKVKYKGKYRKVLAAYDKIEAGKEVITIHPISDKEVNQRLDSGRWIYEKE